MAQATKTPTMTPLRRTILDGLKKAGGRIDANGDGRLSPEALGKTFGLNKKQTNSLTATLTRMEQIGWIGRDVKGKSTKAVWLTIKGGDSTSPKPVAKRSPRRLPRGTSSPKRAVRALSPKRAAVVLPAIGATLVVVKIEQSIDSPPVLQVRNGIESWTVQIQN